MTPYTEDEKRDAAEKVLRCEFPNDSDTAIMDMVAVYMRFGGFVASHISNSTDLQMDLTRKEKMLVRAVKLLKTVRPVIVMSAGKKSLEWCTTTDDFLRTYESEAAK